MKGVESKITTTSSPPPIDVVEEEKYGIRAHWKCLAACTLVSMCPFQYGTDFGLIGGLQAMPGFLMVRLATVVQVVRVAYVDG
jgi:MFS transporter, SP family, sugar:H+ symporter